MSDLSIPGASSNQNTQKIIDTLMEVERIPLKRLQAEQTLEQNRKTVWQDITRKLTSFRDLARALFSFQNPFTEKIAESSDEKILTAVAERDAMEEKKKITVEKLATADRFLSRQLSKDFKVEAGEYVFKVGDKEVRFTFKGGSVKDFVDALNKRGGELLSASVVSDTKTTQVLLLESKKTGAKNRLVLSEKAAELGMAAGMLERSSGSSRKLALTEKGIETWAKPLSPESYKLSGEGVLTLNPESELRIPVQPSLGLSPNMVLELSVKTLQIPEPKPGETIVPPGPSIPDSGSIEFEGIRIYSGKSVAPLPEYAAPKPPERVDDMQVIFAEGGGKLIPLPQIADSGDFQKIQIPIGELMTALDSIDLRNRNTYRTILIKDISVFDKTQRGDYTAANALSEAGDAVIDMDGIAVTRDSNLIDDLIPGVKLTLQGESTKPVELSIGRDIEGIKKEIVGFIGTYDRLLTDIDILTRKDESIITAAAYLTDEEQKKATENLGILMGDLSLQQIKDSMQRIMMNPYPTSRGKDLTLLAQIGVATDVRKIGTMSSIDKSKLRGYLEVDEALLDEAVTRYPEAVRELFGSDTDGDLVVNAGVAYSLDALIRPYIQVGGTLPAKSSNIDAEIARTKKQITDYQKHLEAYEAELKRKYAMMEGALNQLQKNSQAIDNFNKQNSGGN